MIPNQTIVAALGPELAFSASLPGQAYTCDAVFAWEQQHLWDRSWVCLGWAGDAPCESGAVEWNGWLWRNRAGDADPPATFFGNLGDHLRAYDLPRLQVAGRRTYLVRANWKLLVENYLECYHCASTHPELGQVQRTRGGEDFDSTGGWLGGALDLRNSAQTISLDGRGPDWTFPGLDEYRARQVCYYAALPSLFLTATHDYVVTHRLTPVAAGAVEVECAWLFAAEALDRTDGSYAMDFWHVTNEQDWAACASVQRGVAHSRYLPGPLGPQESSVQAWLRMLARAYSQGGVLVAETRHSRTACEHEH